MRAKILLGSVLLAVLPSALPAASKSKADPPVRLVWHVETQGGQSVSTSAGDEPINPASLVKVATSLWALDRLGPDHRFTTTFGTDGHLDAETGVLEGNLIVSGSGDPDFHIENAYLVARELNRHGLKEVRGALLVDGAFWIGWEGGTARRERDPARRVQIMATRLRDAWDTRRWNRKTRQAIDEFVTRRGIDAGGHPRIVIRDPPGPYRGVRPERSLAEHRSNRLQAILKRFNAYSNNDIERLGETLGEATALAGFLAGRWDLAASSLRFETLSGIGSNRLTARQVVRLLGDLRAACRESGLEVGDILPVAGCDPGTLENYPGLNDGATARALVAKTGTLISTDGGVTVLAGFVRTRAGERVFCVAAPGSGANPGRARQAEADWLLDLVTTNGGARPGECGAPVVYSDDDARIRAGNAQPDSD